MASAALRRYGSACSAWPTSLPDWTTPGKSRRCEMCAIGCFEAGVAPSADTSGKITSKGWASLLRCATASLASDSGRRDPRERWTVSPSATVSMAASSTRAHSSRMIHPVVQLFEERAALLDMQQSRAGLDDAIGKLAAWMSLAADHLTEDDWSVLGEVGARSTGRGRADDGQAKPTASAGGSRSPHCPRRGRARQMHARHGRGFGKFRALERQHRVGQTGDMTRVVIEGARVHCVAEHGEQVAIDRALVLTLPPKNVSLAEWFNASKENGNDEDSAGALHAGIQAGGSATGSRRPEHRSGGQDAGRGGADAVQLGQGGSPEQAHRR